MKVCHVVPSLEEQHGGPSKSVRALCAALARSGNPTSLFSTSLSVASPGETRTDDGLRLSTFRRGWPDRVCRAAGLARALATEHFDVIHHHAIWLRTLHYAHRSAMAHGSRLVISPRGMMSRWAWHHHHWRKQIALRLIHPGVFQDVVGWHVTSADEEADIRELGFEQPICIAPNGVEIPEPAEVEAARIFWREAVPESATRPVALFYSRFHPKKRVLELVDLWLECAPADWLLLLVGIPQDYTPETLEQYVLNRSAAGRVRAFSGLGKPAPYAIASLFLLPSHSENFGLVIAEAMAHGVPALVTDTTPWSGLRTDDRGWCVSWADYAATLTEALGEPEALLRDRGNRAKAWVTREFSWDQSASRLARFYAELVSQPHA